MILIGCTLGGTAETPAELPEDHFAPMSAEDLAPLAWSAAWNVDGRAVVPGVEGEGGLMRREGMVAAQPAEPCGGAVAFEGPGVLFVPGAEPEAYAPPPMVAASVVERAGWRLAEILGPPEGVVPGGAQKDPTLHQGIRVRAVTKLRWNGPPWQAIVGERGDQVGVAIASSDASNLASGLVLRRGSSAPVEITVIARADLDGDGHPDLVIAGDGGGASFRAVVSVVGLEGEAVLRSFEEQPSLSCGGP
ncbi:MAG: VCBS repeat-containing protein [Deltaproteobacteria bacterium]|nr:MAG: VCBS repeat-containing protein [Deltaproteobacteria bacterium]